MHFFIFYPRAKIFPSVCTKLESVVMDEMLAIGERAFSNCAALYEVDFPLNLKNVGAQAFAGSGLKGVKLQGTGLNVESAAFSQCAQLKYAVVCNSVSSIKGMAFAYADAAFRLFTEYTQSEIDNLVRACAFDRSWRASGSKDAVYDVKYKGEWQTPEL